MRSIPNQFSIKAMLGSTTLWAIYFASLPQFLEGRDAPIFHFIVSCLSGVLFARALGHHSTIAFACGGGFGSAAGIGAPALFLLLFPQFHRYTRWGGYGLALDVVTWFLITVLAFAMGALFALILTSLLGYYRRWRRAI